MVPDIYQIFIKGSGIFANPVTKESPAKLRYLYEVAPLAFLGLDLIFFYIINVIF